MFWKNVAKIAIPVVVTLVSIAGNSLVNKFTESEKRERDIKLIKDVINGKY